VVRVARTCAVAVLGLLVFAPTGAQAQQLITWTTTSRFVDPAREPFNGPPPGVPARPNALRVNVLLPDGYDGHRRFPVLYLLHGHGDGYDYWANRQRGDVMNVARGFPGIIVMPEGARSWYTNWWHGVTRSRRWHAIAGLSMGGEGALFYASQRPGYFGSAASFSGSISIQRPEWPTAFDTQGEGYRNVFGDPEAQRFYATGHNPTALTANLRDTRLFVTVGDGVPDPTAPEQVRNQFGQLAEVELRQHADDFVASARQAGDDVTYQPRQGIHDWPYWRQHLAAALRWGFFAPVPERPASWTYRTVAAKGDAWGIRFEFQRQAPGTLITFRRSGRTLSATGSGVAVLKARCGRIFKVTLPFTRTLRACA
jgi:S-formylglutathione hydrolase FrmB